MKLTLHITPMGKPRMTKRDKWKKRPCVVRYHAFRDDVRRMVRGKLPADPVSVSWIAYFPMPESWPKSKKLKLRGAPHRQRPDRDNIDKAILDSLFSEDCRVASGSIEKRWDDGKGARIELEIE